MTADHQRLRDLEQENNKLAGTVFRCNRQIETLQREKVEVEQAYNSLNVQLCELLESPRLKECEKAWIAVNQRCAELGMLTATGRTGLETVLQFIEKLKKDGDRHTRARNILEETVNKQAAEIRRLKDGEFTPEELQNLCHNLDADDYKKFCDGCTAEQRKLFGRSREDDILNRFQGECQGIQKELKDIREELPNAQELQDKFNGWKKLVHDTLDELGIPKYEELRCRITQRLWHLKNYITKLQKAHNTLIEEVNKNYIEKQEDPAVRRHREIVELLKKIVSNTQSGPF